MEQTPDDQPDFNAPLDHEQIVEGISSYIAKADTDSVLRPHQMTVFEGIKNFFAEGHKRGYVELPTGTGKTVLFVELAKALLDVPEDAEPPKILVVAPTKDLVHQTVGRSGEKGFGGFAKDLTVRAYFSDSKTEEKEGFTRADVGVTTYRSFKILEAEADFIPAIEIGATALADIYYDKIASYLGPNSKLSVKGATSMAQRSMKSFRGVFKGDPMLDKFDVIILDEAHHALEGSAAGSLVDSLPKSKYIIGFTATPDADEERQLSTILPNKIHAMELNEAIETGLLSPILPIGIKSGIRVEGSDIYDASGEFIDSRISYLREDSQRNNLVIEAAKVFADKKIGTIISCIAGEDAQHARYIAERLQMEGVQAAVVYNNVPAEERIEIYKKFEAGEIDVLTFIGVLGEGWDSQRAKAVINARPTRSLIFATQRPGRVARPGGIAYAVDIMDEFEGKNQPITLADVMNRGEVPFGAAFGEIEDRTTVDEVLANLQAKLPVMPAMKNNYANYAEILANVPKLSKGKVMLAAGLEYSVPSMVNSGAYTGVTEEILLRAADMQNISLPSIMASRGGVLRTVYATHNAKSVLYGLPHINPNKYHVDDNHTKWVAPQGLVALFSKRYPEVTQQIIDNVLRRSGEKLEWVPARFVISHPKEMHTRHKVTKLYSATQDTVNTINEALAQYFA